MRANHNIYTEMSSSELFHKLRALIDENKKLKKLVQSTETEMKELIKKNQEESSKVKTLLQSVVPMITKENSEESVQTKHSLVYLKNIYELEHEFIKIKELILSASVQNIAIKKKIERRLKKNSLLQDANTEYKSRINTLLTDRLNYEHTIISHSKKKEILLLECRYLPSDLPPVNNCFSI